MRRSAFHIAKQYFTAEGNFTNPKGIYFIEKKSKSCDLLFFLEAPPRFELGRKGFADLCLTTWLWRHISSKRRR